MYTRTRPLLINTNNQLSIVPQRRRLPNKTGFTSAGLDRVPVPVPASFGAGYHHADLAYTGIDTAHEQTKDDETPNELPMVNELMDEPIG
jgi:hypothetical protein